MDVVRLFGQVLKEARTGSRRKALPICVTAAGLVAQIINRNQARAEKGAESALTSPTFAPRRVTTGACVQRRVASS